MTIRFETLMLVYYLVILFAALVIQRKKLLEYYKDVLGAIGLSLIFPLLGIIYASIFSGTVSRSSISGLLWFQVLPIAYILTCLFCIFKFRQVSIFLSIFYCGQTFALLYPFFLYTMVATGVFI